METEMQMERKLEKEGWYLQEQVVHLTLGQVSQSGVGREDRECLEGALRTELSDTDMRRIGARSLPDGHTLLQAHSLQGLRVLQILSVSDISESSKRAAAVGTKQSRLLLFKLTDGHNTVTAIELRPIPSVSEDLPPGTKVVLGNLVSVHTGVLLLDVNCIRVLGGHVQAMYDAWEMERKYSGVAREAASKLSLPEGVLGPPPFRGLQLGRKSQLGNAPAFQALKHDIKSRLDTLAKPVKGTIETVICSTQFKKEKALSRPKPTIRPGAEPYRPRIGSAIKDTSSAMHCNSVEIMPSPQTIAGKSDDIYQEICAHLDPTEKTTDEQSMRAGLVPSSLQPGVSVNTPCCGISQMKMEARSEQIDLHIKVAPSLDIENTYLQNRKAAQKLLGKSIDTEWRRASGRRAEGKGRVGRREGQAQQEREEAASLMTLDEWEARKSCGNSSVREASTNQSGGSHVTDEDFAWRLQQQLGLEGTQGRPSKEIDPAKQLRATMFNFTLGVPVEDESIRGRGRGRGRGRQRGRGQRHG